MGYNNLIYEKEDSIAIIYMNRPQALNALSSETLYDLNACLDEVENDDEVKVLIITGAGEKAFIAGADIAEMYQADAPEGRIYGLLGRKVFTRLETMDKPTIAAVNGFALGGGCELSLSCDITIASEKAKFGQPETGLGIIPGFGGTQRLSRLIGKKRAKELIFTCDIIDANEAYRLGIVNHVVPAEELMDYCKDMAKRIAANAPLAIALAKQVINVGMDVSLDSGVQFESTLLGFSFGTEDKAEGMSAFLDKRKEKNFKGK